MDDDDTGTLDRGTHKEDLMQRSISISASIPLISNRPASRPRVASGVRLKLPSIAWAATLIAVGLGPPW